MKVKYIGTVSFQEYSTTGTSFLWQPQQISDISSARLSLLSATGSFIEADNQETAFKTLAERPAAAAFGVGQCQIGSTIYVSDGVSWGAVGSLNLTPNLSDTTTANANAAILQAALTAGGTVSITTPGIYYIGDGPLATYHYSLVIPSNVRLMLSMGVVITQTVANKNFFVNENFQSKRFSINTAGITVVYNADYSVSITLPTTGAVAHGYNVGDWALVKGDTNDTVNGIYPIIAVTASTLTYLRLGAITGNEFLAPAGTITVNKANANIFITGDGIIDFAFKGTQSTVFYPATGHGVYNSAINGNVAHGGILNKIANCELSVGIKNAYRYGVYICNFQNVTVTPSNTNNYSIYAQFNGPGTNGVARDLGGESSDDSVAFVGANIGYEVYDLLDIDVSGSTAVRGSDGPMDGIRIYNMNPRSYRTRSILIAAHTGADITNVYIDCLMSNDDHARAPALVVGCGVGAVCSIKGLVIGAVMTRGTKGAPILQLGEPISASLTLDAVIGPITVSKGKGAGVISQVINFDSALANTRVSIGDMIIDADETSQQVDLVNLKGAGPYNVKINSLTAKVTGTGNQVVGVNIQPTVTQPARVAIGSIDIEGANCTGFWVQGVDGSVVQVDNTIITIPAGAGGGVFRSYNANDIQLGNCVVNGPNSSGTLFYLPSTAKTNYLKINNYTAACDYHLRLGNTTLHLGMGNVTNNHGSAKFLTTNTGASKVILAGDVKGKSVDLDCDVDISQTVSDHAKGSLFFNNKAGSVTAPFAAGGLGLYAKGNAAWTKIS